MKRSPPAFAGGERSFRDRRTVGRSRRRGFRPGRLVCIRRGIPVRRIAADLDGLAVEPQRKGVAVAARIGRQGCRIHRLEPECRGLHAVRGEHVLSEGLIAHRHHPP